MNRIIRSSTLCRIALSSLVMVTTVRGLAVAQYDTPSNGTTRYEFRTEAEVDEYPGWARHVVSQGQLAVLSIYGPVEIADVVARLVSTMHDRLGTVTTGQSVVWDVTVNHDDEGKVATPIRATIGGDVLSVEWYSPFRTLRTTRGRVHGKVDLSSRRTIQPEITFHSGTLPSMPKSVRARVSANVIMQVKGPTGAAQGWLSLEDFGVWRVQNAAALGQLGGIDLRPKSSGAAVGRFVERQEGRLEAADPGASIVAVRAMHDLQDMLVDLAKTETDWRWMDAECELRAVSFDEGKSIVLLWRLVGEIQTLEGGVIVEVDLPLYAALVEYESSKTQRESPDPPTIGVALFPMNRDMFAFDAERAYRVDGAGELLYSRALSELRGPVINALSLEMSEKPDVKGDLAYLRHDRTNSLVVVATYEEVEDGDRVILEHEIVTLRER